ncbi:mitochondrial carrier domain-containing protein [Catenaria anguillulae PL171]|uniref:Mitochondrial carrier domain-containing protein n=1 Tax=Catenaria anguillulae PL171 TaxID=765915 RepID=A0A1Y2HH19_9FUNG|nr:mitochondrial carrier domain-containing protein [Catenaria anguillulae PL171]
MSLSGSRTSAQPKASGSTHLTAGALSGLASCVLLQPFDVVKTRLQQRPAGLDAAPTGLSKRLVQLRSIVSDIVRERGVPGLWRGTTPTVLRNVPGSAFYFFFLHHLRTLFARHSSLGVSRDTANMLPAQRPSSAYAYTSVVGAARDIVTTSGVRGLFAGFGATAARDVPYAGIYVVLYEQMKGWTEGIMGGEGAKANMSAGVMAGTLATAVTQPFDLVKTRVQVDPRQYPNSLVATRKVFATEGLSGFFKGMTPRLLRKPLHAAITWTVYEKAVSMIRMAQLDKDKHTIPQ